MCQLLGMNCNVPTDIIFSFEGFRNRGGITDFHDDGFGIAFFEDNGIRIYHDNSACAKSPVADLIRSYPVKSKNVISHIRKATQGDVSLSNTHPFIRELWGQYWIFAHNGDLKNFNTNPGFFYNPVGNSDSEKAFCYILEQLRQNYIKSPSKKEIFRLISILSKKISRHGIFNFMISNGKWLIVHANTLLYYIIRKAPFGVAQLKDNDLQIDFSHVTTPNDKVAVIATIPLTNNEKWQQFAINEIVLFEDGEILYKKTPRNPKYLTLEEGLAIAKKANIN